MKPPLVLRLIRLKEATGQTVCLLTNQGPERLSDALAARIYKLRWGIEVMWRDLKQTMSHHKTLGTSPGRVQAELDWALAGLWMLQLISVERMIASKQLPHRYSPASSLRVLRRAMGGKRRKRRTLVMELTQAVKDTYCRKGSKKARHYPKKRPQRPPGEPRRAWPRAGKSAWRSGFSSNRRLNWLRRSMAPVPWTSIFACPWRRLQTPESTGKRVRLPMAPIRQVPMAIRLCGSFLTAASVRQPGDRAPRAPLIQTTLARTARPLARQQSRPSRQKALHPDAGPVERWARVQAQAVRAR